MKYHQLTSDERVTISAYRKQGMSAAAIARMVGRHKTTIWREFKRNCNKHGIYRPSKAQENTVARRRRSRRNSHFTATQMNAVVALLARFYSPAQISGRHSELGFRISHETIYRYVWEDWANGGNLYKCLRQRLKQRRKRQGSRDSRGILPGKRHISERPASVESRRHVGHWEIDTVMGSSDQHCILTLVERKTGFVLIGKLTDRKMATTAERTKQLIKKEWGFFDTITSDNGTEFHAYKEVEDATGVTYYFATPYHSWERGTNENTNGLIRQYLPKRQSMARLTQHQCNWIANELNTRPRKRHGFKTPREMLHGY